jgi:murein DD-endopeptidase MepM/ murein hydrolase activator NlpD
LAYGLWGALLGLLTYRFIHGTLDGFHGLNYVLTAMALGGFFLVANRHILPLVTLGVVAAGVVDRSASLLLNAIGGEKIYLPTLALAFNAVTLLILYPIKTAGLRQSAVKLLIPVPLALVRSPETNLRWQEKSLKALSQRTMLTLPFMGEWSVLQGNDGEWTHKAAGRYAWDFVITDSSGKQHRNFGLHTNDYYAFGLPVLAPAPGVVVMAIGDVEDNQPRTADLERNWGNYVVIDHGNGEFSELSHFRQHSLVVAVGQPVQRGQLLGNCGNSGRSPVPHIHFQLQQTAKLGAITIPACFTEGTINGAIGININPRKDEKVSPVETLAESSWTLLGKETEVWRYECVDGWFRFVESLHFTTDIYGWPVVTSGDFTWYILDRPSFIELVPDFKTRPDILVRSAWVKLIGESLVLPKKLSLGFEWRGGKVSGRSGAVWTIDAGPVQVEIDANTGLITTTRTQGTTRVQAKLM